MNRLALLPPLLALLAGCVPPGAAPGRDYAKLRGEDPASILVVPVVNRSVDVAASGLFLSTLTVPLADRGYYVFPVYLVKGLMEEDGLGDAGLVHQADPRRLGQLFGADAILYATINRWDAKYAVLSTSVEVDFDYVLKSGRTGEELWKAHQAYTYVPSSQSTGNAVADLIGMAVAASIVKAAPDFMPLARSANHKAFHLQHQGLPAGPHSPQHGLDKGEF
ncbi:DUF799 domain-containing protein [Mesoterricola silvestris]|uniref:Lipoprotein n=1 Tax=Mesoterricola silvestris TaxID=2927979 RepID=A0AA48GUH6_9BACT|nr:GNA1162 family protein [Mesoterricola silvestris]BDU72016.1 lipoprotein [Mesoterricola silvestris]